MQAVAPKPADSQPYKTVLDGANALRVWQLAKANLSRPSQLREALAEAAVAIASIQRDCTATLHAAYLEGATSFADFVARTRKAQEQVASRITRLADHPQVRLSPQVTLVFFGQGPFDSAALDFRGAVFAVVLPPKPHDGPTNGPPPG